MSHYLNLFLIVMLCVSPNVVMCQIPGCSFQNVDLVPCLSGNTTESCCKALNQALLAGHQCLCSLLAFTNLLLASTNPVSTPLPLGLAFPGCYLSAPSLAACQVPFELGSPPAMDEKPDLAPTAPSPEARPVNDIHTAPNLVQSGKPELVREVPNSSKNIGNTKDVLILEGHDRSSSATPEMEGRFFVAMAWVTAIFAWIAWFTCNKKI